MLCIICQSIFAIGQEFKYKDPSLPVDDRVTDLLRRMTLEEKIAQMRHIHANSIVDNGTLNEDKLSEIIGDNSFGFVEAITFSGKDCLVLMNQIQNYILKNTRLSIPIFTVSESLHGSVHDGSTIYPQAIALGSTFNTDLAYRMTSSIARELRAQGIIQTLTPVLDVCRDLRWGRVEECFGEDPFLVSKMGIAQVKGYLDNKISPMIKHFGAHGTPQGGLNLASVACGERELLSIYLKPFEEVVTKTDIWAVMSSYNSWNNEPNTASHYLLTDLLRNRWGFKGYVYSDWGAIGMLDFFHHTAVNRAEAAMQALLAGVDAEAADNCYLELKWLVENGYLDVRFIDQAVGRILKAKFELGLFEIDQMKMDDYDLVVHSKENKLLARKIADESVILLKNNNNLLPLDLSRLKSIAVIGPNADTVQFGDYTWSRDNKDGKTLFQSLKKKCEGKVRIDYAKGCDLVTTDKTSFENAINIARKSDISIIVVGSASASLARDYSNATSGEGFDLSSLDLPGVQEDLIKEIHAIGKPVVVVLLSGKPFSMPWVKSNIPSILVQWYPGEEGGAALVDILTGEVNPSGKLNFSFPMSVGHLPCHYNYLPTDKGFYRSPGSVNIPGKDYVFSSPDVLWAFGHGLSYSEFEYVSALLDTHYIATDTINVLLKIRNNGPYDGLETPQIYIRDLKSSVVVPIHELKAFDKVFIKKGHVVDIEMSIPVSELALYNKNMDKVVEDGDFEVQIGRASNDIRIRKMITVGVGEKILNDENRSVEKKEGPRFIQAVPIMVTGTARDVQANVIPNLVMQIGGHKFKTDIKGKYKINGISTDTLLIIDSRFVNEEIPINGRDVINIQVQNK